MANSNWCMLNIYVGNNSLVRRCVMLDTTEKGLNKLFITKVANHSECKLHSTEKGLNKLFITKGAKPAVYTLFGTYIPVRC
jgi:hypothetical protein